MQKRETPTVGKRWGQERGKNRIVGKEDNIHIFFAVQGFSGCVPCATCPYSRIVRFSKTKFRHQCGRDRQWLEACGVHECRQEPEGGHRDA